MKIENNKGNNIWKVIKFQKTKNDTGVLAYQLTGTKNNFVNVRIDKIDLPKKKLIEIIQKL